jgi:hypothetical protein
MSKWRAIPRMVEAMGQARDENPRGDLYRTLPMETLLNMLEQNVKEVRIAVEHDNDVRGKCADVANYASFILDNHEEPAAPPCNHTPEYTARGVYCKACRRGLVVRYEVKEDR